jgi:hypothetical protein
VIDVTESWLEAIRDAYMLARGERYGEMSGKRAKRFDERGLHPYSLAWGRIYALEDLHPELRGARLSDPMCDPVSLRRIAQEDAEGAFRDELLSRVAGVGRD